jgi:hypothetical protein
LWKLADDALSKPVTFIQCKEILDSLIKKHINIISYWNAVKDLLVANSIPQATINKMEKDIVKILEENAPFDEKQFMNKFLSGIQNAASIVTLIQAIFRIW